MPHNHTAAAHHHDHALHDETLENLLEAHEKLTISGMQPVLLCAFLALARAAICTVLQTQTVDESIGELHETLDNLKPNSF